MHLLRSRTVRSGSTPSGSAEGQPIPAPASDDRAAQARAVARWRVTALNDHFSAPNYTTRAQATGPHTTHITPTQVVPIVGAVAVDGHETHVDRSGKNVTAYRLKQVGGTARALVRWSALDKWVAGAKRSSKAAALRLPQSFRLPIKRRLSSTTDNSRLAKRAQEIQLMLSALTDWASQHLADAPEAVFVASAMGELFEMGITQAWCPLARGGLRRCAWVHGYALLGQRLRPIR